MWVAKLAKQTSDFHSIAVHRIAYFEIHWQHRRSGLQLIKKPAAN